MTTSVARATTVDALRDVWSRLDDLLAGLDDDAWSTPTALPGWDVKDVAAHVVGTEAMLLGEAVPDVAIDRAERPHVRNDIGDFNERWIVAMA
ncbi:MAG: maleylpyruvate isomerase family mycothiol-dependent enzyme, partial [Actinomycetota bacterium]|nr:maleylpyruvate isomerase family mycothiol-dependent enzyme [Actinomycetota bacterium]